MAATTDALIVYNFLLPERINKHETPVFPFDNYLGFHIAKTEEIQETMILLDLRKNPELTQEVTENIGQQDELVEEYLVAMEAYYMNYDSNLGIIELLTGRAPFNTLHKESATYRTEFFRSLSRPPSWKQLGNFHSA
jgi:hypothetical protein